MPFYLLSVYLLLMTLTPLARAYFNIKNELSRKIARSLMNNDIEYSVNYITWLIIKSLWLTRLLQLKNIAPNIAPKNNNSS